MEIRRGDTDDLAAIARIQAGSPEAAQWKPTDYLSYDLRVAIVDGCVAGFLVVRENGPGEFEILNLAVDPGCRRRGLARQLVAALQLSFNGTIFLEVRECNKAARKLYKSMGFQEVSLRREYYNSPLEAAIVMKFCSC